MATLDDLANQMETLAASLAEQASDQAVKVAMAVEADLLRVTPVDTSNALSNWQVTLGSGTSKEIKPYYPGEKGSTQEASIDAAFLVARTVLDKKKPGETIYITNNAPYIVDLNDGNSKQAPRGFVERAILIGRTIAADFKVKI